MSIRITLTEKEILETPNNEQLGELVRNKYWKEKDGVEDIDYDMDYFGLNDRKEGLTSYDKCVMCGKESPYLMSTHIDLRVGYVEGLGQTCIDKSTCGK
jgi:hypothetical protein